MIKTWLPWLFCLTALTASAGGAYTAWARLQQRQTAWRALKDRVETVKTEWIRRQEARAIVRDDGPSFRRLLPRTGWRAQRLDWVAGMREWTRGAGVVSAAYRLGPRQTVWEQEGIRLWRVPIDWKLGLVHEESLLRLWQAQAAAGLGRFSLERCRLTRSEDAPAPAPGQANLQAECTLDWYGFSPATTDAVDDDGAVATGDEP